MTAADEIGHETDRLTSWFRQHGQAVRGYLLAAVRRPDVADDLAQEVFRRAWQARENYREQGTARAYLLKIADRLLIDHARKSKPEVHLDEAGWSIAEPADPSDAPSDRMRKSEAKQELDAALALLTGPQKRVLLLRYYSDMSFAEIAETVGCPLSTALSHGRRGLLALRKIIAESMP
jgi:RNA polymerase sigma-70 factor (ECF subfamily)